MPCSSRFLFSVVLFLLSSSLGWGVAMSPLAQDLSRSLKPQMGSTQNPQNDLQIASGQLVKILEKLEKSARGTGPQPSSLVPNAFSLVKGLGKRHELACISTVLGAWDDARGMGLFNERGKFGMRITKGRDLGKNVVFERLATNEQAPMFGKHYANVRLTIPSRVRKAGEPLSVRDQALIEQLANVKRELEAAKKSIDNGPTTDQLERERFNDLWEAQLAQVDEESRNQLPVVQVLARKVGSSTQLNKGQRRYRVDLKNSSGFPIEVTVKMYLVGEGVPPKTKERIQYMMGTPTMKVRLLAYEGKSVELYASGANSLHGHVTEVLHAKGRAGSYSSNARLAKHLLGAHGGMGAFQPWPSGKKGS